MIIKAAIALLAILGWLFIIAGILMLIMTSLGVIGTILVIAGITLLIIAGVLISSSKSEWKALASLEPERRYKILKKAKEFGSITTIQNVTFPKVTASHTKNVNVLGLDDTGAQVLVGVDAVTLEAVKFFLLCPRNEDEATEVSISEDQAKSACMEFLRLKGVSVPASFELKSSRIVSLGPWKRWRFVWQHQENGVTIMPDFIMIEVNATEKANVLSFSKVEHPVQVDLSSSLSAQEALNRANEVIHETQDLQLVDSSLSVVYPNKLFNRQVWEWSDNQALSWILRFEREQKHVMDVWIDAANGNILGGYMCHLHSPELYGIDAPGDTHMGSHIDNIWTPFFDMIKFDASASNYSNNATGFLEGTVSNSIASGRYFIVEGHGDVTATAEKMNIAYQGSADEQAFTPDEVPANNLRFVFLDTCQSGHDGTGQDFKDTFISQGSDVFIGFDEYMCAWTYEESLLHYLAQGLHLANAHNLAEAEASPWYPIVITYNLSCLNRIRLAPILVTANKSPTGSITVGNTFQVEASINNREDVDHTIATNVQATLVLPPGFSIVSGANPQNVGNVNWNSPLTTTWTVRAPVNSGTYDLDIEVSSDNLGVAVDDPDEPFQKFEVEVTPHFWMIIIYLVKIFTWILPTWKEQKKLGVEGRIMERLR
ncbi:MAG: phage holin family protein [Candidatus Thiodiazotropha sp.]